MEMIQIMYNVIKLTLIIISWQLLETSSRLFVKTNANKTIMLISWILKIFVLHNTKLHLLTKNIDHQNISFLALTHVTFLFRRQETDSTAVHKAARVYVN